MSGSNQTLNFLPALIGALVGGSVTFFVNVLKAKLDIYESRYEDLCKQILTVADLSAEYWLLAVVSRDALGIDKDEDTDQQLKARLLEVRIEGLQQQVLLGDEELRSELPDFARKLVAETMPVFVDALTGATFKARDGNIETIEAALVQFHSATLISAIRTGLRSRYRASYLIKRLTRRH